MEPSYAVNAGMANRQRDVDLREVKVSIHPQVRNLAWLGSDRIVELLLDCLTVEDGTERPSLNAG
jgi:hypothetical protein